jgi:replicative DNA helicase
VADGNNALRPPRCDLDAEGACLSLALLDRDAALELIEVLSPADYWSDANRTIHEAIRVVCTRGDVPDAVAVVGELRARNALQRVGGAVYVMELMHQPTIASVTQTAKTIKNWARVRLAQAVFRQITAEADTYEMTDVQGWLDSCERRAYEATAAAGEGKSTVTSYAQAGALMEAAWAEAASRTERTWGTATGFHRLDEHTLGMTSGQLWFLGGRPGQGKTSGAQQIGEYVAERGGGQDGVILLSQEMEASELLLRTLARTSGVPMRAIKRRKMDRAGWEAYVAAQKRVETWPIEIDDEKRLTPMKVRAKVRRLAAKLKQTHGARLKLVIIDYVQQMQPDSSKRGSTRAGELGEITAALKAMAGEFDCTFLVLSQLTRPEKNKPVVPPTLFDFRDSGSIESDGDLLIGLHRPDQYAKPNEALTGVCEWHVLKGRACGECAFELRFDGRTTCFDNIARGSDALFRGGDEDEN